MNVSVNRSSTGRYEVTWDSAGYRSNIAGKTFIIIVRQELEQEASASIGAAAASDGIGREWTAIVTGLTSNKIRVGPDQPSAAGKNGIQLTVDVLECGSRQRLSVGHNEGEIYTVDRRGRDSSGNPRLDPDLNYDFQRLMSRLRISSESPAVYSGRMKMFR